MTTPNDSRALKACPFCSESRQDFLTEENSINGRIILCRNCYAQANKKYWNTRQPTEVEWPEKRKLTGDAVGKAMDFGFNEGVDACILAHRKAGGQRKGEEE